MDRYAVVNNDVVTNVVRADEDYALEKGLVNVGELPVGPGWLYDGETFTAPPVPVPPEVTRRQAKQALLLAGLLGNVQTAIDAIPDATERGLIQIEWDDSQVFQRDRPALIGLGSALGLDSDDLDNLFRTAAALP